MAGRGLSYKAELDTTEAIKKAKEFNKELAKLSKMSVSPSGGLTTGKTFDVKPLTAFQQGILKIKQETLDLAKVKQAQAAADKSASLVTQEALKQERLALIALKAEQKAKKPAQISNSQAEIDAYNNVANGSSKATLAINEQNKAQAKLVNSAVAVTTATANQGKVVASTNLSRKQAAKLLAEEKYIQQQATRELKNNIREQLNAKGSLEQRRAALIRLNIAYDRLSVAERGSAAGGRLNGIIARLNDQVLTLEKNTGRSSRNVGNYLNKAWGGLKLIANILPGLGIAGLLGFAIEPLMNYIGGLDLFKKKLDEVTITRNQLNDVNTQGAKDAQLEVVQLKVLYAATQNTNISLKDRNKNVDELQKKYPTYFGNMTNEAILAGNAATSYRALAESIIATARARASEAKIAENSGRQLDNETTINNALIEYDKQGLIIATATAKQKTEGGQSAQFWADQSAKAEERQAAAAKIIRDAKRDSSILDGRNLELTKNIVKQQEKGAALTGYDPKTKKVNTKAVDTALNSQRSLQAEIDALTKRGVDKQLDADAEELANVDAKYKKLTEKAIAFNNNKSNIDKGLKVNLSGIAVAQKTEQTEIKYKHEAEQLKISLDQQADLYAAYEETKNKIGKEKADIRYESELGDQKTYLERLEKQREDMVNPGKAKGGAEEEVANQLALKVLDDRIAKQKAIELKAQDELLAEFMSYSDKRKKLEEKYQEDYAKMFDNPEAQAIRTETYNTQLGELDDANIKKLDAYKKLFEGVDKLSAESAREVLVNARKMLLTQTKMSKELRTEIEKLIVNTQQAIKESLPDGIINIARQLDEVANSVGDLDEAFGKALRTVANIVGQVGNIKKGMADFKTAKGLGDGLGQLTAGLGIFGAAFSIFKTASDTFGADLRKGAEQQSYARELQGKQTEAVNKALERQIELINEAYGTDRIGQYNAAILKSTENEKKFQDELKGRFKLTGNQQTDALIKTVNDGGSLPGMSRDFVIRSIKLGGGVELPTELEELRKLLDGDLLDSGTKIIVAELIEATEKSQELRNNLKADRLGASLGTVANEFMDSLTDGLSGVEDFLANSIRRGLLEGLKGDIIKKFLNGDGGFYEMLDESLKDGVISADEDASLRKKMKEAEVYGDKKLEYINTVAPENADKNKDSASTLQGDIKSITTEQAGVLTGTMNGMRLAQLDGNKLLTEGNKVRFDAFAIAKGSFDVAVKIEQHTFRTANNTDGIKEELASINRKIGSNAQALAANGR